MGARHDDGRDPPPPQTLRQLLVARYDSLLGKLARRLGSREAADDALHDAWLRLEREPDLSAIRDPFAYVVRIASNEAATVRRRETRRAALLGGVDEGEDAVAAVADDAPDPERHAIGKSEWAALRFAMETLPPGRRDLLLAVFGDGMSVQQLADQRGVSARWIQLELKAALAYCAREIDRK